MIALVSVNVIAWRRVRSLNGLMGERFVAAWTLSHDEHWWWFCIRYDGSAVWVHTQTLETADPGDYGTSTTRLLKGLAQPDPAEEEWLETLRVRHREVMLAAAAKEAAGEGTGAS